MQDKYVMSSYIVRDILKKDEMKEIMEYIKKYDLRTYEHCMNVADSTALIALQYFIDKKISMQEVKEITQGAMIHDVGKVVMPNYIINKPDKLSNKEYDIIKEHPLAGYKYCKDICKSISELSMRIVIEHHERLDGTGYPYGLKEKDICIGSKIVMVCDSIDAITQVRSYKSSMSKIDALNRIQEDSIGKFDAEILKIVFERHDEEEKEKKYEYTKPKNIQEKRLVFG